MNVWIGEDPDDLKRVRADLSAFRGIRNIDREVVVICSRKSSKDPSVVAIVYPTEVSVDHQELMTATTSAPLGSGLAVDALCACGQWHRISTARVRAVVASTVKPELGPRRVALSQVEEVI